MCAACFVALLVLSRRHSDTIGDGQRYPSLEAGLISDNNSIPASLDDLFPLPLLTDDSVVLLTTMQLMTTLMVALMTLMTAVTSPSLLPASHKQPTA